MQIKQRFDLPGDMEELRDCVSALGLEMSPALDQVLDVVERSRPTFALLERDYSDPDYDDEYAHFYNQVFRRPPSRCDRLHFFGENGEGETYLGFCVLRPNRAHPVCRTVVAPPEDLRDSVACLVDVTTHSMGQRLSIRGFPFMEQDSQHGTCAHVCIWMVALYHHLAHETPRRFVSDIRFAVSGRPNARRTAVSGGLSLAQMHDALEHLGLTPVVYDADALRESTLCAAACRYLNSGFPVIAFWDWHVNVIVGYGHDHDGRLFFVRCDDGHGPYERFHVDSDPLGDWRLFLAPTPGKIFLSGEAAEVSARDLFRVLARTTGIELDFELLRLRTYVTPADTYKSNMAERGMPDTLCEVCFGVATPTWIWMVELQDVDAANQSRKCVIGEIAFDATSSSLAPGPLFGSFRDRMYSWPEVHRPLQHHVDAATPYLSATLVHDHYHFSAPSS